jgi:hypothetical protein
MTASSVSPWLPRAYVTALLLHAAFLVLIVALAVTASSVGVANAAPDTMIFALLVALPVLMAGLPSLVALLSWYMCRRRGWTPSPPHMGLTVASAAVLLVGSFVVVATA